MEGFSVPVVMFVFKRLESLDQIIGRIRTVKPQRMYILSDGPRNDQEKDAVLAVRKKIDELIDWECQVIKNYATKNRGVYENIGLGAKWVFEREESAIFLEDDNLPETTFFEYCSELLEKYRDDSRILWVCGSNYLERYNAQDGASYVFTRHMLPCGWASWSDKFNEYYDGELELFKDNIVRKRVRTEYENKKLYIQQSRDALGELHRKEKKEKFNSWDYQMAVSIRENSVYGIAPCNNQIKNIGVDQMSIHGGNSMESVMTRRFCELETSPLKFPLVHPKAVLPDSVFEREIANIILFPLQLRIKGNIIAAIKYVFGVPRFEKFTIQNVKMYFWRKRTWI